MLNILGRKHVKWAMPKSNNTKGISDFLRTKMGINKIDILESSINDNDGKVIEAIWVLEFDAAFWKVAALKRAYKLREVNGYLI